MADETTPAEVELADVKMPWWKKSVDEMVIGIVMGVVAVAAIYFLKDAGSAVATAAVTGLAVYLKKDRSGNGDSE